MIDQRAIATGLSGLYSIKASFPSLCLYEYTIDNSVFITRNLRQSLLTNGSMLPLKTKNVRRSNEDGPGLCQSMPQRSISIGGGWGVWG